ncbi:MAG: hypothetical protein IIC35_01710 [Gemmatimonadetes bacterium]|nr:hypothetical protein [Gemmatimonadota bacterium]
MENGHAPRVALIVPASNTVMETDFARAGDPALEVTVWRIQLDSITREAEERMLDEELPAREWASPTTMKSGRSRRTTSSRS